MNLIAKITACIGTVLLLAMVPFSWLNVEAMKRLLHEEAVSAADNLSETILFRDLGTVSAPLLAAATLEK